MENNSLGCMLQSVEILEENKIFLYKKGSILDIVGYSNVDWAGSKKDKRSTSEYCVFLVGNLVTWRSKKQVVVFR